MADEINNVDENVENQSVKSETTVKKKAAKKKAAKKKATTKKKVTTKKKTAAKKKVAKKSVSSGESSVAQSTPTAPPEKQAKSDSEATQPTTATTIAAAGAQQAAETESKETSAEINKTPSSNVVVQMQLQDKDTSSEEKPMSSDTKSSGGFWIKVTFWLIIIILGFMYIRSLAKNPAAESATDDTGSGQAEEVTATESQIDDATAIGSGVSESVVEDATPVEQAVGVEESAVAGDEAQQPEVVESTVSVDTESPETAAEDLVTESSEVADTDVVPERNEATVTPTVQQEEQVATDTTAPTSSDVQAFAEQDSQAATTSQEPYQSARDLHAKSVSNILKEFDELRDAAQAEREAMQKRVQAERELREAMMPRRPPRMWQNPGYAPYGRPGPYQGYYNYR
jgi:hypothetical protein